MRFCCDKSFPKKAASLTKIELEEAYQTALEIIDALEYQLSEEQALYDALMDSFEKLHAESYC